MATGPTMGESSHGYTLGLRSWEHPPKNTRPGKHSYYAIEHGPVEIVDLPSYKMVIFHSYVNLPEGKWPLNSWTGQYTPFADTLLTKYTPTRLGIWGKLSTFHCHQAEMPLQGFSQDLPLLTLRRENLCLPSAKVMMQTSLGRWWCFDDISCYSWL